MAALVWVLCRLRRFAVRLHAFAQSHLCGISAGVVLTHGLGFPRAREALRADSAGHRGGDPFHDASEFARVLVPAHAAETGSAVVVACYASIVLPVLDRRRYRADHRDRV